MLKSNCSLYVNSNHKNNNSITHFSPFLQKISYNVKIKNHSKNRGYHMSKKPSVGGKIQWTKMFRKLSPYTIRKGFRYMKHYGPKEFWIRLHERFEPEEVPYGPWYRAYIPTEETLETQRKQKFDYSPLIKIGRASCRERV